MAMMGSEDAEMLDATAPAWHVLDKRLITVGVNSKTIQHLVRQEIIKIQHYD